MNQIKSFINRSNNLHSLGGNLLNAVFNMLLFIIMIRLLNKEMYGRWVIFLTAISLLDMLRLGLIGTGAIRAISTSVGIDQKRNIAAPYYLSIFTTLSISFISIPLYFIFQSKFAGSYYLPVLLYYPILAFANLAHMQAATYNQGISNFKRILIIRSIGSLLNMGFISAYIYFFDETFSGIVFAYGISDIILSLYVIIRKWDGLQYLKYFHKPSIKNLLNFGKYSVVFNLGSVLLKSSDTIIISLSSVMGAQAVAIYAIPFKFLELVEIPLRSFTATAYPKLSAALCVSKEKFNTEMNRYLSFSVLMLLPVMIFIPLFSGIILRFFGGNLYADSFEQQKAILFIITIYIIALPHDRYSGIALLAFDKPKLNFYKVLSMLFCNVVFDFIAVFVFKSLVMVAVASVFFTLLGIAIGWFYINKFSGLTLFESFKGILNNSILFFDLTKKFVKSYFRK